MARRTAEEVALEIGALIAQGEWGVDSRLPPERLLADRFGVARNTLRNAVALLERDGRLRRIDGRGAFVADPVEDGLARTIRRIRGVSPADMMEVRLLVEPAAAAAAAINAGEAALGAIEAAHKAMLATQDQPEFEHHDAEFHQQIFAGTKNDLLKEIHNILIHLRNQPVWTRMKQESFNEDRRKRYCDQHGRILDGLRARMPQMAFEAMDEHVRYVRENLR